MLELRRAKQSGDGALDRRQLVVNDEVNDKLVRRTGIQSAVAASLCRRTPKTKSRCSQPKLIAAQSRFL